MERTLKPGQLVYDKEKRTLLPNWAKEELDRLRADNERLRARLREIGEYEAPNDVTAYTAFCWLRLRARQALAPAISD